MKKVKCKTTLITVDLKVSEKNFEKPISKEHHYLMHFDEFVLKGHAKVVAEAD